MKPILLPFLLISMSLCLAEPASPKVPKQVSEVIPPLVPLQEIATSPKPGGKTMGVEALLIGTKWSRRNVSASVPDRECVFMAGGTFRHPLFSLAKTRMPWC